MLDCWADLSKPGGYRRTANHHPAAPTDIQSEVLVPGLIHLPAWRQLLRPLRRKCGRSLGFSHARVYIRNRLNGAIVQRFSMLESCHLPSTADTSYLNRSGPLPRAHHDHESSRQSDWCMLGGAVGDALGWPQEDRSQIIGGRNASEVEPRPQFRSWERNGGTRYGRYVDPVRAGEYSDDTQLMLATARSCLLGDEWIERLRRVELPQWPLYQRGGGGAVLRAARAWEHGKEPWSVGTAKDRDDAVKYFNAGANGVAMRIAPHAVIAASMSIDQLLKRIVLAGFRLTVIHALSWVHAYTASRSDIASYESRLWNTVSCLTI